MHNDDNSNFKSIIDECLNDKCGLIIYPNSGNDPEKVHNLVELCIKHSIPISIIGNDFDKSNDIQFNWDKIMYGEWHVGPLDYESTALINFNLKDLDSKPEHFWKILAIEFFSDKLIVSYLPFFYQKHSFNWLNVNLFKKHTTIIKELRNIGINCLMKIEGVSEAEIIFKDINTEYQWINFNFIVIYYGKTLFFNYKIDINPKFDVNRQNSINFVARPPNWILHQHKETFNISSDQMKLWPLPLNDQELKKIKINNKTHFPIISHFKIRKLISKTLDNIILSRGVNSDSNDTDNNNLVLLNSPDVIITNENLPHIYLRPLSDLDKAAIINEYFDFISSKHKQELFDEICLSINNNGFWTSEGIFGSIFSVVPTPEKTFAHLDLIYLTKKSVKIIKRDLYFKKSFPKANFFTNIASIIFYAIQVKGVESNYLKGISYKGKHSRCYTIISPNKRKIKYVYLNTKYSPIISESQLSQLQLDPHFKEDLTNNNISIMRPRLFQIVFILLVIKVLVSGVFSYFLNDLSFNLFGKHMTFDFGSIIKFKLNDEK